MTGLLRGPGRAEWVTVAPGVDLHLLRWDGGDGVPFVLVHGLASNAHLWDGVAAELAAAGHPVLAVDQRGHGRSSKPDGGYDMASVTDDLRVVVDASGFDRPVLVGQSWGGNVVIEFAARFPDLARAIGCIDGGAIELAEEFPDWERCAEILCPPSLIGTPAAEIEAGLRHAHPDWPESGIAGTMACFEVRDDATIAPWLTMDRHLLVLRGLWEHRPSERFALVAEPVLFVVAHPPGDRSRPRRIKDATTALDDVRVQALVGVHDLHAQHPVRVAALLRTLGERPH